MSKLTSEKALLETISRTISEKCSELEVGIGDDCAVFRLGKRRKRLLVSTDLLQEGPHFRLLWTSPFLLGFKSLAVNVSDVAAMGGRPSVYVVSMSLPGNTSSRFVEGFYRGLDVAGGRFGAALAGGDLAKSPSGLVISLTIFGETCGPKAILRRGARAGDILCVTGYLGLSAIGLQLLRHRHRGIQAVERAIKRGLKASQPRTLSQWRQRCLRAHLAPEPPTGLAADLGRCGLITSMIDLSDGLSTDLAHLCEASDAGAVVDSEALPCCPVAFLERQQQQDCVLHGGEEYGLLFTLPPDRWDRLKSILARHHGTRVTRIGRITDRASEVLLQAGSSAVPLPAKGFDHFARK